MFKMGKQCSQSLKVTGHGAIQRITHGVKKCDNTFSKFKTAHG